MNLPIFYTDSKDLSMLQTKWASAINPILANPANQAYILKDVKLQPGVNTINHLQDHPLNGYVIVGMQGGFSQIYDVPSSMPSKTLVLNSSAAVTVRIMVF